MPEYPPLSDASVTSFLDDIPQISVVYREDGLLMALNSTTERIIGVPRAAIIGRFNVFENEGFAASGLVEAYRAAFRGESTIVPASEINLAESNTLGVELGTNVITVESLFIPLLRRADGTAPYALCIQRDISELARIRRDIEEAQRRISAQHDTIASLEAAKREIEAQRSTIEALSTPVIEVWDGIVTLPLLGHFNAERAGAMTTKLLEAVVRTRARYAILDLTGLALIDSMTGDLILRVVGSVGLLGTTGVLVGIQPEIARCLVNLGAGLDRIRVYQDLRQALKACMREQGAA